jgi:HSP20 family protein
MNCSASVQIGPSVFYGTFERRFSLPENVNADSIRCESKEGILTVHIPKTETSKQKAKQITVQ